MDDGTLYYLAITVQQVGVANAEKLNPYYVFSLIFKLQSFF